MDDILQQTNELKIRLEKVKEYTHRKMLLKQRVPVALNSPKMKTEGEDAVLNFETEVKELKILAAGYRQQFGFRSQPMALNSLVCKKLCSKVMARLDATGTKNEEHGDACREIVRLAGQTDKMSEDSIALDKAGKFPDENTQREHEMKFHELCQEVLEFMEVHGVTTPKNIEGVRENSVNSSHSAVHSMCDDQAVSSLNTPSSIEIDA
ncbi:MAG: hypothetical protein GY820_00390, partial [Gammaproteobacteria bacterium]|nr:hypothetical protein [Gammaproteobacteria bacterium]